MSKPDALFVIRMVPSKEADCPACNGTIMPAGPSLDDAAMRLAHRGASPHQIAHVMLAWAAESAERAMYWADKEDARAAQEAAEAYHDATHGTDYHRDDERDG